MAGWKQAAIIVICKNVGPRVTADRQLIQRTSIFQTQRGQAMTSTKTETDAKSRTDPVILRKVNEVCQRWTRRAQLRLRRKIKRRGPYLLRHQALLEFQESILLRAPIALHIRCTRGSPCLPAIPKVLRSAEQTSARLRASARGSGGYASPNLASMINEVHVLAFRTVPPVVVRTLVDANDMYCLLVHFPTAST